MSILFVLLVVVACSDGSVAGESSDSTLVPGGPGATVVATSEPSEEVSPTTTTTLPEEPALPVLGIPDAPAVELLTPTEGVGARPVLEWTAVPDASRYVVVVYTETGASYWSASTGDTRFAVGCPEGEFEDCLGPEIGGGFSWAVIALDVDGLAMASSERRSISP